MYLFQQLSCIEFSIEHFEKTLIKIFEQIQCLNLCLINNAFTILPIKLGQVSGIQIGEQSQFYQHLEQYNNSKNMRKVSQDFNKKSASLVLSEGKWAKCIQKPQLKSKLQNFSGLLYLEDNGEPKILKQIVQIRFSNLLKLSLEANNIESVQHINELFCPKLAELQLGDNKITSIKSLRRANLQNLKILSLRNNKIIEFQALPQLYSIIRSAFIQWYSDEGYCNDASWILKLETFQFKSLWLESRTRIIQSKVFHRIQQRFPLLKLYYNKIKA